MDFDYHIFTLNEHPWYIRKIAEIYMKELSWYYKEEFNINTTIELIDYIYENCMKDIYIIISYENDFIGTMMATRQTDNYYYWISCLYIDNKYDKDKYSNILINHININTIYMWIYQTENIERFEKLGFTKVKMINNIYIMKKDEFVIR